MNCPNDRRLFEVHTGDGTPADRAHAAVCPDCGARLRVLARDLARIDGVLRRPAPALRPARRTLGWQLAPIAVAAALLLAVMLGRGGLTSIEPSNGLDAYSLADEVAAAVAGDADFDDDTTGTTTAASTCTYGDPLLGVGCDEPAVMQVAWR